MRQALRLHPDSLCVAAAHIDVDVTRPRPRALLLTYEVSGSMSDLLLPSITVPDRADELWRHTCFEAFVATAGEGYYEFNLAPSTQWAAYRFDGYRSGMRAVDAFGAPWIEVRPAPDRYTLQAVLDLERLPDLPHDAPWRLGLSAVIEDTGGRHSYWALAHPPGKPDFHHPDCFAIEISPA